VPQKSPAKVIKTIYLIRHGQTDFNKAGIVQGSGVDSDLNDQGRKQAQQFFDAYKDIPFDHIYISKLKRTYQTIEPFTNQNIPITTLSGLNEINWGIMEGAKPTPESHQLFLDTVAKWRNNELDTTVENGETPLELFKRQKVAWELIFNNEHENCILICMHGRAMRSFLCLITGHPLMNMDDFEHGNVCLYVLEKNEGNDEYQIVIRNSRIHLHHSQIE
jgi:broad specificity phosphatase PhoE